MVNECQWWSFGIVVHSFWGQGAGSNRGGEGWTRSATQLCSNANSCRVVILKVPSFTLLADNWVVSQSKSGIQHDNTKKVWNHAAKLQTDNSRIMTDQKQVRGLLQISCPRFIHLYSMLIHYIYIYIYVHDVSSYYTFKMSWGWGLFCFLVTHLRNTSMVEGHQLRRIIEETVQRHTGTGPVADTAAKTAESTAIIETPVAWYHFERLNIFHLSKDSGRKHVKTAGQSLEQFDWTMPRSKNKWNGCSLNGIWMMMVWSLVMSSRIAWPSSVTWFHREGPRKTLGLAIPSLQLNLFQWTCLKGITWSRAKQDPAPSPNRLPCKAGRCQLTMWSKWWELWNPGLWVSPCLNIFVL